MILKKFKRFIAIILVATFIMPLNILAYSDYVVAGGETIGIQLNSKGIIIAGFYKVNNVYPAMEANLEKGDIITKVNNKTINNIDDFINSIKSCEDDTLKIIYERNNQENNTVLKLVKEDDIVKTGLYVKDTISGIGTLTFIDPNTKLYGALGHEVTEGSSGVMVNIKDGKIFNSSVTGIDKSVRGDPGAKNANIDSNDVYGTIKENTISGIFGNYTKEINNDTLYKVASYKDIKLGEAKLITVLEGNKKEEYSVNILKINNNKNDNKNILFEITDENLIKKTGGIIQGMSGSPIVQNNNIIGAVTNVVVNDPTRGYAILITSMLQEAEN